MNGNDLFIFSEEYQHPATQPKARQWNVLIVDDTEQNHTEIKQALDGFIFHEKGLCFLSAFSLISAKELLQENAEIDVIILNSVLESEDWQASLTYHVREVKKNTATRVILQAMPITQDTNLWLRTTLKIALQDLIILKELHALRKEKKRFSEANQRFFPQDFIQLLGKKSILDIKLGDHVEKTISVLFLDIRSFTTLSEFDSPTDAFQFINSCMSFLEPIIVQFNGFVDKYIGDAIMALFPGQPEDAVKAGIQILQSVEEYNNSRLRQYELPIKVGIGINTGNVVIGTVGSSERMECTVIGDTVNVAARLEKLNKTIGCNLLISENTYSSLKNQADFHCRHLGKVKLPGKKIELNTYEVYDADPIATLQLKQQLQDLFSSALKLYQTRNYAQSREMFTQIITLNTYDSASRYFLDQLAEKSN